MVRWKNETEAKYDNHEYIVKFFENGIYAAYVKLNEEDRDIFEKIQKNTEKFKEFVPNGFIYVNEIIDENDNYLSKGMWLGFGTNSLFDLPDISKVINVFVLTQEEKLKLLDDFKHRITFDLNATIKSSKYMVNACMDLIDRLKLLK